VRVVFDTNIYISAFITPGGRGEAAFTAAMDGRFRLFTSIPILTETAGKLAGKFRWERERMVEAVQHIATVAEVVRPRRRLAVLTDDPDNRILECARAARADFVVTGDKHLLKLGRYGSTRIVTLVEFLGLLSAA
jgi:putative PIN family toxin of toxin-antitoxin system